MSGSSCGCAVANNIEDSEEANIFKNLFPTGSWRKEQQKRLNESEMRLERCLPTNVICHLELLHNLPLFFSWVTSRRH